jgi:Tetracyclin repressor-like, C-terminal domain/Bacterial regulatory proteins, tetR family
MTVPKKKGARNKSEILGATIELLESINYSSLTIEAVAARSSVGKTTIYRWWKHKSDLVFDAFIAKTETIYEFDLTKSTYENFVQQLLTLTSVLKSGIGRAVLTVVAEEKEIAAKFLNDYLTPRRVETKKILQVGVDKGEIQDNCDFGIILDMLYGPIYFKFILFNRIPDQAYIESLVTQVMKGIGLNNPSYLEE